MAMECVCVKTAAYACTHTRTHRGCSSQNLTLVCVMRVCLLAQALHKQEAAFAQQLTPELPTPLFHGPP